jgi:hypothetical protein
VHIDREIINIIIYIDEVCGGDATQLGHHGGAVPL